MAAPVKLLSKAQARRLTERIKAKGEELWVLLAEAHEGQAFRSLGYRSWKDYAATEFGMSERSAFRVLDQGKVAKALTAAAGQPVQVSQRQATAVKPRLDEAVERLESGEVPDDVVREIAKDPAPVADVVDELTKSKIAGIHTPWTRSDEDALEAAFKNQGPAPRETGEGEPTESGQAAEGDEPHAAKPEPTTVQDPAHPGTAAAEGNLSRPPAKAKANGGGKASQGQAPSVGSIVPPRIEEALDVVARLTPRGWRSVDDKLLERVRASVAAEVDRRRARQPTDEARVAAKDCRHPANTRIGNFCGSCRTTLSSK